jgi:hypothetical protein
MSAPIDTPSATRPVRAAEPVRRKRAQPLPSSGTPRRRRLVHALLIFSAVVLLVDSLVGDTGFIQRMRARRQVEEAEISIANL